MESNLVKEQKQDPSCVCVSLCVLKNVQVSANANSFILLGIKFPLPIHDNTVFSPLSPQSRKVNW